MSHVKGYTKTTKSGKRIFVKQHDDKRSKHGSKKKVHKHVVRIDPGMIKMREYITGLLRTSEGQKEFEDKIKQFQFQKALPEVIGLYGVEQGAHHRIIDAFGHTMEVLRKLPKDATDNQRWAAILHDIGKPPQQKVDKNRGVVFDGHEYVGSKMAKKVLDRLGFNKSDKEEISFMILHHGDLRTKLLHDGGDEKAKKFMKEKHFDSLLTLHNADVVASGRDPKEVNDAVKDIKSRPEIKKTPVLNEPEDYVGMKWKWKGGEREVVGVHSSGKLEVKTLGKEHEKFGPNLLDVDQMKDQKNRDGKALNDLVDEVKAKLPPLVLKQIDKKSQ